MLTYLHHVDVVQQHDASPTHSNQYTLQFSTVKKSVNSACYFVKFLCLLWQITVHSVVDRQRKASQLNIQLLIVSVDF